MRGGRIRVFLRTSDSATPQGLLGKLLAVELKYLVSHVCLVRFARSGSKVKVWESPRVEARSPSDSHCQSILHPHH